jgi:hypothetical protein
MAAAEGGDGMPLCMRTCVCVRLYVVISVNLIVCARGMGRTEDARRRELGHEMGLLIVGELGDLQKRPAQGHSGARVSHTDTQTSYGNRHRHAHRHMHATWLSSLRKHIILYTDALSPLIHCSQTHIHILSLSVCVCVCEGGGGGGGPIWARRYGRAR